MNLSVDDHMATPAGSPEARDLAARLREYPERERYEFIECLLPRNVFLGLQLANSCLRAKHYFQMLLLQGFQAADASSIQFWLAAIVPRLGVRHVLSALDATIDTDPEAVDKALYWLPRFVPKEDRENRTQLEQIQQRLNAKSAEQRSEGEPINAAL